MELLTLGCTSKLISHRGTRGGGCNPPLGFCGVTMFRKYFSFIRLPVMGTTEIRFLGARYIILLVSGTHYKNTKCRQL